MLHLNIVHRKKQLMTITSVAILLAVSLFVPIDDGDTLIMDDMESSDANPIMAGVMLAGTVIGLISGYLFTEYWNNTHNTIVVNDAEHGTEYISGMLGELLGPSVNTAELMAFTNSYFERMGELAACEQWTANGTMNADNILLTSTVVKEYSTLLLSEYNAMDSIFEYTNDMTISYVVGSQSYTTTNSHIYAGIGTTVSTGSADRVYLYGYEDGDETSGHLYVYGGSAVIKSTNGSTYQLSEGDNDLHALDVPNGYYELQTGRTYIGSMMSSLSSDKATLCPAAVLDGASSLLYITNTASGVYMLNGNKVVSSVQYAITDSDSTSTVDITNMFTIIGNILNASNLLMSNTVNAASAAWSVFNTAGSASSMVSPSSLIPNLENMDFTDDQIYLIYMSALQQMSDYFDTATGNFDASDILVSENSLDLICQGTIYTNSYKTTEIINGYFTPMCYLRDQRVEVGTNAWMQTGLAMVWNKNSDGTYYSAGLVVLESGNYMDITSMVYRDTTYSTTGNGVTLHITSLTALNGFDNGKLKKTTTYEANWLQIILIVVGALGIVAGLVFRRFDFVIIGIAAIAIGWLAGSWLLELI